eukprot:Skav235484  [mRNA]  locus=scaffold153:57185:57508:+ [translate_table: standard]
MEQSDWRLPTAHWTLHRATGDRTLQTRHCGIEKLTEEQGDWRLPNTDWTLQWTTKTGNCAADSAARLNAHWALQNAQAIMNQASWRLPDAQSARNEEQTFDQEDWQL